MPPQRVPPPIRERGTEEEDKERFTSRDLTRKQITLYIFEDFFKGSFIFASLFIDGLVVAYLYMEPFVQDISPHLSAIVGFPIYKAYFLLLSVFIDAFLIYYEFVYYHKLFGEEAVRKRYEKKKNADKAKQD